MTTKDKHLSSCFCTNLSKRVAGCSFICRPISYNYKSSIDTEQAPSKINSVHRSTSVGQLAFQANVSHKHIIYFCATKLLIPLLGDTEFRILDFDDLFSVVFFKKIKESIKFASPETEQNKPFC